MERDISSVTGSWREPRTPTGRKLAAQTTLGSTIVAIEREAWVKGYESVKQQDTSEAVDAFIRDELPALLTRALPHTHEDVPPEIAAKIKELRKA